jgi:hypothetical protein
MSWTVQAVTGDGSCELPEAAAMALATFAASGANPQLSSGSVRFERDAFRRLTGFHTELEGRLSRLDVKRAAEDASPQRAKALTNCYGDFDYGRAAEFLRICAKYNLAIQGIV